MHFALLGITTVNALAFNTLLIQLSALVGTLLPLLVAVVQRAHWPGWLRTAIGVVAIIVASVITAASQHKLNLNDWAASALTVFLLTKTTYLAVWKPSGVAPWIEAATSPSAPAAPPPAVKAPVVTSSKSKPGSN